MPVQDWTKYLKFRCTGCGNCCRETIVCITDQDVQRIVEGTGHSPRTFVHFFSEEEVTMDKRDPLWVRFDTGKAVMGLRWKDDHCIFLHDNNRCTIYEHRPVTCRDHPFNVTLSETGAVERISLSRIVPCPHAWDGNMSRRSLRAIQTWNEQQQESYIRRIKEWNKREVGPKTRPAFLRFLGFEV